MHIALHHPRGYQAAILIALIAGWLSTSAQAADLMPPAQQNALVQKYCAVCHTDSAKNGGLSLEHFDAGHAAPSLTAMLLSKITGGVSLRVVSQADTSADAAELVNRKMKSGAMGAAGIPIPDKATIDALIRAFAAESAGATDWFIEPGGLTASILREMPSATNAGEAEDYRLIASCNSSTQEGSLQLAWAPVPQSGTLAASVDGNASIEYRVEGTERMGNGSGVILHGRAALMLIETKPGEPRNGLPFPAESLTISDLFPGESAPFSFANFPKDARHKFEACFPGQNW